MRATWVDPILITQDGYYPLQAAEATSQIYKIDLGVQEYYLIENRQPILWDSDIDGGGIVIYRVDETKVDQSTRGYPGHPNWPTDHYMVSVIQADGLYEIEQGLDNGNAGDFWTIGMKLGPNNQTVNTASIVTGVAVKTGITIEVVTRTQFIMMIHVTGIDAANTKTTKIDPPTTVASQSADITSSIKDSDLRTGTKRDAQTANHTSTWVLSMLGGSAALIGFLVLVL